MSPSLRTSPDEQLRQLTSGTVDLVDEEQLLAKLAEANREQRPLTVKAGFDPSAPDLHLGHTVLLEKMRQFQAFGHRVVFVIGDVTARVGDPTGRKATRPQLSAEEIEANLATYEAQLFRILDEDSTVIERNSRWLDELDLDGVLRLAGRYPLARMMEREDFRTRWDNHQTISIHELLYPLMQGYDSIALRADVELGGTDQLFNLLVGRHLMKEDGLSPQVVMTVPLLVGTDGTEKMSKSLGNAIGVEDPPQEIFGKTMSIADDLMWDWWLLLTGRSEEELREMRDAVTDGSLHPKKVKEELAQSLVRRFHGDDAADQALQEFNAVFRSGGLPDDVPLATFAESTPLLAAVVSAGLASSRNEARRLLQQGAISVDGERCDDPHTALEPRSEAYVLKVGKRRFLKAQVG